MADEHEQRTKAVEDLVGKLDKRLDQMERQKARAHMLKSSEGFTQQHSPVTVYFVPSMQRLAESLVKENPDRFRLGQLSWEKFPDGFPNLFIKDVDLLRGHNTVFLCSFLNHDELLAQLSMLFAIPRYLAKSLTILMPYFPTGTMERVDEEGQVATAMTFARLFSAVPLTAHGPTKLVMYDIHALQNRFYFSDNIIPVLNSGIPLFVSAVCANHSSDRVVIAFPDEGATKRFGKKFHEQGWQIVTCTKVRQGTKRIVSVKEGEEFIKGAHVFIVDDLCQTGGTLRETRTVLFERGAVKVSAYVTHAVFPSDSWKKFIGESPRGFDNFYVTDSVPETVEKLRGQKPFQVLSIGPSLCETLEEIL